MHLSNVNESLDHKITGGSEYGWNCYPEARYMDYESDYAHVSVLFSTETQIIYSAEINDKANKYKPYRWLNPSFKDAMYAESKKRNIDPDQAWDDTKWVDVDVSEDWLEKAEAMFNGEDFDTRIQVPIDLDNDTLLQLAMEAHKRDITLNQMVEELLREVISKHQKDNLMDGYEQDLG